MRRISIGIRFCCSAWATSTRCSMKTPSWPHARGGIPMCGVPHHAVDTYIARLVKKGFRVAICDQVEDPRKAKGLVKREVVRVVSPGTLTDAGYLDAREPAFLMAIYAGPAGPKGPALQDVIGVALLDLSTGDFSTAEYH